MIVVLVGVPGSGKSTILKATIELCPFVQEVNYGEIMLKEAALRGADRDALRKMAVDKQQEIGQAAAARIAKESKGLTIIDTHACIRTETGYCPGLPLKILNALNPKAFVMVECPPDLIVERRLKDASRKRDEESLQELSLHQELTRAYLAACSTLTGAVLCIVQNGRNPISENIHPLQKLLHSFSI